MVSRVTLISIKARLIRYHVDVIHINHECLNFQIYLSVMVGFAYMADAMEMMILSILGPALHCQWHITGKTSSNLV